MSINDVCHVLKAQNSINRYRCRVAIIGKTRKNIVLPKFYANEQGGGKSRNATVAKGLACLKISIVALGLMWNETIYTIKLGAVACLS